MTLTMDPITETYDERETPELNTEGRVEEVAYLAKRAVQAIQWIDDHCDGVDASRKSHAIRQVRALEAFALTLLEA